MSEHESLSTAADDLRRPFAADAPGWKIEPSRGPNVAVCFIDRGLVIDRLNVVVPHLWGDDYEQLAGSFIECALTIAHVTRKDVGQARKLKARYSDAFKRAAVKFGVGAYLMRVPVVLLEPDEFDGDHVNEKGLARCRAAYAGWLNDRGITAFGEVLDHGDAGDAQGDPDDVDDDEPGGVEGTIHASANIALRDRVGSLLESAPKEGLASARVAEALGAREGDVLTVLMELVGSGDAMNARNRFFARSNGV